ncbi:hypothetical protein UT300005_13730 [Clostridium sp. CTA-5]
MKIINLVEKRLYKKNIILGVFVISIVVMLNGCGFKLTIGNADKKDDKNTTVSQQSEVEYNKDELLPLGTIVLLKDSKRELVITGRMQRLAGDSTEKIWDYSGCSYPRGFMSDNDSYGFNTDQIEKVYFRGYEDKDEIEYNKQLIDFRNKIRGTETKYSEKIDKDNKNETENIVNDKEKLLALGSIITVEGSNKKLMIIGRVASIKGDNSDTVYDYAGCIYPEGNINKDTNYAFNAEDINKVYFRGYEDEKEIKYNKQLLKNRELLKK